MLKEDISFQWVIDNGKALQDFNATLTGPAIVSKILPINALCFRIVFTNEGGIVVQFGDGRVTHVQPGVWICDYSVALPSQSISSEKCYLQVTHHILHYNQLQCVKVSLDKICYSSDETLTLHVSAFLQDVNISSKHTGIGSGDKHKGYKLSYSTALFPDCTITIADEKGSEKFRVHKAILASVSKFFLNILKEETKNIELNDIDREEMSNILAYIYSGTAPVRESNVTKLILAADRFHLDGLVKECVYEIQKKMTSWNVVDYFRLSSKLTSCGKHLKSACVNFIRNNSFSVYQSDSWKTLKESSIGLALEVAKEAITTD